MSLGTKVGPEDFEVGKQYTFDGKVQLTCVGIAKTCAYFEDHGGRLYQKWFATMRKPGFVGGARPHVR